MIQSIELDHCLYIIGHLIEFSNVYIIWEYNISVNFNAYTGFRDWTSLTDFDALS